MANGITVLIAVESSIRDTLRELVRGVFGGTGTSNDNLKPVAR
jgi:hypothetical protein